MYFFTVIAFAAFPFLAGAFPVSPNSSPAKGPRSFSLTKHLNHSNRHGFVDPRKLRASAYQTEAKYERALSAYEKRTGETHRLALNRRHSNERRYFADSNFTFTDDFSGNLLWTALLTVGDPQAGLFFQVQLDTSTSDTFLCGVSCLTCYEKKRYDYTLSTTANNTKKQGTLNGFAGLVTGDIVTDLMNPGGTDANVTMVVATKIGLPLQSIVFLADGIVGMGLPGSSSLGVDTWFAQIMAHGGPFYGEPVFGMVLSPSGTGPKFVFGGRDTNKFSGNLNYTGVTKNAIFWEIGLDSVIVNGNDINTTNKAASIDSSASFIGGDSGDIANIYGNIPGSAQDPTNPGHYIIPCDTTESVTFKINGIEYPVHPDTFILGPVDSTETRCYGGFVTQSNLSFWVFGTPFMENFYIEFDEGKRRVGLAPST